MMFAKVTSFLLILVICESATINENLNRVRREATSEATVTSPKVTSTEIPKTSEPPATTHAPTTHKPTTDKPTTHAPTTAHPSTSKAPHSTTVTHSTGGSTTNPSEITTHSTGSTEITTHQPSTAAPPTPECPTKFNGWSFFGGIVLGAAVVIGGYFIYNYFNHRQYR